MIIKKVTKGLKGKGFLSSVKDGYLQGGAAALPDIDIDYASDRREDVRKYVETRYNTGGLQRVFSCGTFTTLKVKAALSDVARAHKVQTHIVKYITAIIDDDAMDFTDFFKLAYKNKKVRAFIEQYPYVIEDMRALMGQPRSSSIHASAIIPVPSKKDGVEAECFDYLPIKKVDGILISELDGYSCDEIGMLKLDCLNTVELTKLNAMFNLVRDNYGDDLSLEEIEQNRMHDDASYGIFRNGFTQNIFQFGSDGMSKLTMDISPTEINDIVALNALYRPATIELGSPAAYSRYKHGEAEPVYLWGTHEIMKDTYSILIYQEQLGKIANAVGGFSLAEGVALVKYISKKKVDKIKAMKAKFMKGASDRGCPESDANSIWEMFEASGTYLFNKCISGKETLYRMNGGKWIPTIGEMYKIKNDLEYARKTNHLPLRYKYRKEGYGSTFSLNDDNRLVLNNIKDIRFEGVKHLYRITIEGGATIDVTDNHKHPTQRGKLRTDELIPGKDLMFFNIGHKKQDTGYRFTDKGKINNEMYHSKNNVIKYKLNSEKGHVGFTKRPDSEYVKYNYYRENLLGECCENCGAYANRFEVHHKNGDHSTTGDNFDNLATLCISCHKKAHYAMGRRKVGEHGLYTELRKVISVEYIGEDEVYDVEMEAPHHSFATMNGVVTCNSHATAYGLLSYVGAYLKAHYPTAFYTVALQYAKDDDKVKAIMLEMECASNCKIVPPDINVSGKEFETDYEDDYIYWSLSRIKHVGGAATTLIIEEREANGPFKGVEDFIERIQARAGEIKEDAKEADRKFTNPVNSRTVKHLIYAGCFDICEGVQIIQDRFKVLEKASNYFKTIINEKELPEDLREKQYKWAQLQIMVSTLGSVDYKRIYEDSDAKKLIKGASYSSFSKLNECNEGSKVIVCATIADVVDSSYTDKQTGEKRRFGKVTLQQDNETIELVIWNDGWINMDKLFLENIGKIVVAVCYVKYNPRSGSTNLSCSSKSFVKIVNE